MANDVTHVDSKLHHSLLSNYNKTVLPNGLRIVTEHISHVRSASIGVWINVGSRDEHDRNNGISHFLEHMVFKGTKRYRTHQIAQSLESVGGYLNAFTSKEHTCFYARVLDEYLPKAIDVLSDLVQYPRFEQKEIEKEKQVVIEEIKNIEDNPDDLIYDYFDHSVFHKHPLGYPVIGTEKNVSKLTRSDLMAHLERHYTPDRIVVAAAGNLLHEDVIRLVEKFFRAKIHRSSHAHRSFVAKSNSASKEIFEKPITQSHVCLGTIGYSVKSKQRYPLLVLNTLLGEGMSSRLFQNIREKYGFAYNVYSFANFMSDTGSFGVYIGTDKNNIDNSIELIHKELGKLKEKDVSKAELKRTKAQIKGTMMLGLENMSNRMMRLGSGELYYGAYTPIDEILSRIDAVDVDDLSDLSKKLFRLENYSTVIFTPAMNAEPSALKRVA